jgi:circadian clock protein KaiB
MTWADNPEPQPYVLRLFVTGTTARSQRAISNLRNICDRQLGGRCDLEVIDVYLNPEATRDYQIVATPTLVKVSPEPLRRIVGDLSDRTKVLLGLSIPPLDTASRDG